MEYLGNDLNLLFDKIASSCVCLMKMDLKWIENGKENLWVNH